MKKKINFTRKNQVQAQAQAQAQVKVQAQVHRPFAPSPAPEPITIDLDTLDPMYKALAKRSMKRKFIRLELFDPDDNGKLLSETIERTVADAFKFYVTHFPKLYQKWGGSVGVFRLMLCGEYKKSPNSTKITLTNAIKLTRLELSE